MKLNRFEKDLLRVTLMESIDALKNNPQRNATPLIADAFVKAINARDDLLRKVTSEPVES